MTFLARLRRGALANLQSGRGMLWLVVGTWVVVMVPGVYFMLEHTVRTMFGGSP